MRAFGESRRGGPKTPAGCVLECFDGLIILKAEIHLAIAIGIAIAIDPSWDGRLIPIPIPIPKSAIGLYVRSVQYGCGAQEMTPMVPPIHVLPCTRGSRQ